MKSFKVTIELDKEVIEDLIISALEGGSNYWYRIENKTGGDYLKKAFTPTGLLISDYKQGMDGKYNMIGRLNPTSMRLALDLMQTKAPHVLSNIILDHTDAEDADIFLQLAVLGDVIYG